MLIAALHIARSWKQPGYPSTNKQIKENVVHSMKYYSAVKKYNIMEFIGKWMESEKV